MPVGPRLVRRGDSNERGWYISSRERGLCCWGTEEQAQEYKRLLDNDDTEEYFFFEEVSDETYDDLQNGYRDVIMLNKAISAVREEYFERQEDLNRVSRMTSKAYL